MQEPSHIIKSSDIALRSSNFDNVAPIRCIVVGKFDISVGYIIETSVGDIDLVGSNIEYKLFPSGSHEHDSDTVLFRFREFFGIGAYRISVDHERHAKQRGAVMVSVGILSLHLEGLLQHRPWLHYMTNLIIKHPFLYPKLLDEYFIRCSKASIPRSIKPSDTMDIARDFDCASTIMHYGLQIMTLWKYSLLRRKILVIADSSVSETCKDCYTFFNLGSHNIPSMNAKDKRLEFLACLPDIANIQSYRGIVACTTDAIMAKSDKAFDIVVCRKTSSILQTSNKPFKLSRSDRKRYRLLMRSISDLGISKRSFPPSRMFIKRNKIGPLNNSALDARKIASQRILEYFQVLNRNLHDTLLSVSGTITKEVVLRAGFNISSEDLNILEEYSRLHNLNLDFEEVKSLVTTCFN